MKFCSRECFSMSGNTEPSFHYHWSINAARSHQVGNWLVDINSLLLVCFRAECRAIYPEQQGFILPTTSGKASCGQDHNPPTVLPAMLTSMKKYIPLQLMSASPSFSYWCEIKCICLTIIMSWIFRNTTTTSCTWSCFIHSFLLFLLFPANSLIVDCFC